MLRSRLIKIALRQRVLNTKTAGISDFFNATSGVSQAVENAKRTQAEGGTGAQRAVNADASSQPIGDYSRNLRNFVANAEPYAYGPTKQDARQMAADKGEATRRLNYLGQQYPKQLPAAMQNSAEEASFRKKNYIEKLVAENNYRPSVYDRFPMAEPMPELRTPWKTGK